MTAITNELQVNKSYRINCYLRKWGTREYGIWRYTGIYANMFWFEDEMGACLTIPKEYGQLAPADPWILQLTEDCEEEL